MRIESGHFKGRSLPRARRARPVPARLKRSLFMVLEDRLEGAAVLDLFAGVGGLGLEALVAIPAFNVGGLKPLVLSFEANDRLCDPFPAVLRSKIVI